MSIVICATLLGQQPDEEARAKQTVEGIAKIQRNWGSKMSTPGVAISLKETSRRKVRDQTAVTYRLFGSGLPKDKVYTLIMTGIDLRSTPLLEGVTVDESGQAVCAGRPGTCGDSDKPNDPIDLKLFAARGEPKRFALVSEDGGIKAFTYVVPFPIVGSDGGCSVEAILLLQNAEAVYLRGSGFEPKSSIHFASASEGETQEGELKADPEGNVDTTVLSYVKGKSEGKARVSLKAKACSPSISFDWGKNSYQIQ